MKEDRIINALGQVKDEFILEAAPKAGREKRHAFRGLAAALAPEHVPEPEQLKAEILSIYAKFNLFDGTVHQKAALHLHLDGLLAKLATKAMPTQMIKTDRVTVEHSSSVDAVGGGLAVDKRRAHITLKQDAAQDRAYIESCFGRSLYPPERLRKAEQELCTGVHLGCHLWFSAGVPSPEQAPTPEARQLAQQAELQAERNRAYYAKNQELLFAAPFCSYFFAQRIFVDLALPF